MTAAFRRRRALVTGAAGGIGAAIAHELTQANMDVVRLDRDVVEGTGSIQADLSAVSELGHLVDDIETGGPIDVLVSCAGIFEGQLATDLDLADYDRTLRINLHAAVYLMSAFASRMAKRGYGRIVAITSIHARLSEPTALAYDVGKGGLDAAVRTIAIEHADCGVLVNAVAPGFVRTAMSIVDGEDELDSSWFRDQYLDTGRLPMRRAAEPREIASAVGYLASDANTYVTGSSLTVDGGLSARF